METSQQLDEDSAADLIQEALDGGTTFGGGDTDDDDSASSTTNQQDISEELISIRKLHAALLRDPTVLDALIEDLANITYDIQLTPESVDKFFQDTLADPDHVRRSTSLFSSVYSIYRGEGSDATKEIAYNLAVLLCIPVTSFSQFNLVVAMSVLAHRRYGRDGHRVNIEDFCKLFNGVPSQAQSDALFAKFRNASGADQFSVFSAPATVQ
jgi:hypothetical protein